ncbi:hypothetical protein PRZ48_011759 [Zasmidium cellare]|uniref:F-box domain-containing protein n=1 Tax=Zasmidium cellare TaxID=395010 RepID=A0ABR0E7K9_ZASCE|nr:hypothetical protein PRZ48_011759 [Zasmidium cellare]
MAKPSPADGGDVEDEEVKPFRLLDLPPEIWSKIGKMVIDDIPEVTMYTFRRFPCKDHQAPILRTCRVVREELLPYFWEAGVKVTCSYGLELGYLRDLLAHVGEEHRRAMCDVRFEYGVGSRAETLARLFRVNLWDIDFELTDRKRVPVERSGLSRSIWADAGFKYVWTVKFL